jgi:predicted dehydrogenase/aryl-alcohol dehydrogenase-like predicted oxidoreductase
MSAAHLDFQFGGHGILRFGCDALLLRIWNCAGGGTCFSDGMSPSLNWGILGTGSIARKFASELPHSSTGRLVAVGSRSAENAAAFGEKFPGIRAHASYEALLADPDVEAVYVSTPHPQHAQWAIAAAEAGKHILCEKPLTLNHAEAMSVVEAARRHGVFLMEAFMYRCHPRTAKISEFVREGAVGKVRLIRASFSFASNFNPDARLFSNALGGGGILDVGCYATSVARLVAGAAAGKPFLDPVEVRGSAILCETGVDTVAVATLKFPGDVLAELSCGVGLRLPHDLEVFGEEGTISVPSFWNPPGPIRIHHHQTGETSAVDSDPNPYKYALEADAVALALPALESPAVSWDDTLGNLRTLDAWRESIKLSYASESPDAPEQRLPVSRRPLRPGRHAEIPRRNLPWMTKPMSRLVLGVDNQRTFPHLAAMVDDFFERGGNVLDTAHIYGSGVMEELLGHWFAQRGTREETVLIVKGAHTPFCDPENLRRQFLTSLERLQTDYADFYLMHRDNPDIPVDEFVDVLDEFRQAGKIRAYGGSNWSMGRLREANAYALRTGREPFRVVSNNLSLARMMAPVWDGCVSAKGPEWREFLQETGMALLAWSSQARGYFVPGLLANDPEIARCWDSEENRERRRRAAVLAEEKGVSSINIALAYVLSQPYQAFALFGPRTLTETRTSLPGANLPLTPEELAWLDLEIPDRV